MGIINTVGRKVRNFLPMGRLSYSQEGEDLLLSRLLDEMNIKRGFFVDIGAHHPTRFSNTYYFYRRGWVGLNVDPLPGTKKLFNRMRPKDTTLECGVGLKDGELKYFSFNEPALNTFSEEEAKKKEGDFYKITSITDVPVFTLKRILDENLPEGREIDFLTIDAEGLDHEIVVSNDWSRYRPKIILIELLRTGVEEMAGNPTFQLLAQKGYCLIAKTMNTSFFVDTEAFPNLVKRVEAN